MLVLNFEGERNMKEIEIRTIIKDVDKNEIIKHLLEEGYELTKDVIQHDIMFDKEDASLFRGGSKIRLRIEGNKKELTYKGSLLESDVVSRRTELNFPMDSSSKEDIEAFMTAIGYPLCFQIKKHRIVYSKGDVSVSFDEWPIIGCMLEIEGSEEEIINLSRIIAPNYEFGNRRLKDFFADKMKETGKTLEELKALYEKETGFDLGKIELVVL